MEANHRRSRVPRTVGGRLARCERSHEKAWVGLAALPFRLGHDAPASAPAVAGRPSEVLEPSGRLAALDDIVFGQGEFIVDLGDKAGVPGQTEEVVDPVLFAPSHQSRAAEAACAASGTLGARPPWASRNSGQGRHDRIVPKLVVIVEVLVTEHNSEHPLANQRRHLMLDQLPLAPVPEAGRQASNQTDRPICRPQQKRPASEVTAPPLKAANTCRPSTCANSNCSDLHSVASRASVMLI